MPLLVLLLVLVPDALLSAAAHLSLWSVDLSAAAFAPAGSTGLRAVKTLPEVIDGMKAWIAGILAAVATLFLMIGGLRYMTAAGDPAVVEQAKGSFKAALTGYALAVLAPVVLQVLQGILGA